MTKKLLSMTVFAMLATSFVACDKSDDDNANDVDLGLPSGVKWAKMNVGATKPWDYGDYYAWGETETKSDYSRENYKYCNGTDSTLTKYNYDASCGTVDNKMVLEPSDDVATITLGNDYSIPTNAEWDELSKQCYWVWTTNYNEQNVSGYIVYRAKSDGDKGGKVYNGGTAPASYSLSDAHIFLPAAGYRSNSNLNLAGDAGHFWSSSIGENFPGSAKDCVFYGYDVCSSLCASSRFLGHSVRPVKRP